MNTPLTKNEEAVLRLLAKAAHPEEHCVFPREELAS